MKPWTVLESHYMIKRWWMNLRVDHVRLPHGTEIPEFHVVEGPDWAGCLCLTEDGQLVMVEQYRHGVRRVGLELPAGAVAVGEEPLVAARRELLEETGYAADDWTALGCVAPEPTRYASYAHFFVAHGARRVQDPALEATEDLAVRLIDPAEALRRVCTSDRPEGTEAPAISNGLHRMALLWAERDGLLSVHEQMVEAS